jgi:hypothetical protein
MLTWIDLNSSVVRSPDADSCGIKNAAKAHIVSIVADGLFGVFVGTAFAISIPPPFTSAYVSVHRGVQLNVHGRRGPIMYSKSTRE